RRWFATPIARAPSPKDFCGWHWLACCLCTYIYMPLGIAGGWGASPLVCEVWQSPRWHWFPFSSDTLIESSKRAARSTGGWPWERWPVCGPTFYCFEARLNTLPCDNWWGTNGRSCADSRIYCHWL